MEEIKKPSIREQFSLNIESDVLNKIKKLASNKGIPLNTFINMIIEASL